ncbi:hypothetical protein [Adhaeribacter soli]|uniref:Uncharacterized protein n=1 Tax=Adhaeribacter soli TaxID=2607655 RepID=A0A5N1J180_9BACT|nr:hypothetical protein [Adhaeribacter soli]KAA9340261.1 hypothetical protein F0P94_07905 [Adhaeribacter soli]
MTPAEESKVLQGLYDNIFAMITYAPGSDKPAAFDPARTLLQFSKMEAINPDDFKSQLAPNNPNGSYNTAYNFFAMTDIVPSVEPSYKPSSIKLADTFKQIVNNANTDAEVDPAQKKTYDSNYNYLNQVTLIPNPEPEPPTEVPGPSPIAQTYDDNQTAYITAIGGYRNAMLGYDLTKVADQRAWNAVEPGLSLNVDKAWNNWTRGGKANVERAQNALQATINDIVSSIIADGQKKVSDSNWLASGANKFLMTYPLPSDWYKGAGSKGATKFTYKSSVVNTSADSKANSYGGGASWGGGLWSVGGSFNHTDEATSEHFDGTYVEISAKLTLVKIMRPWLNTLLFRTKGWWLKNQPQNGISNGQLEGNADSMLPLIPTAFVVMSDVKIKSDFSEKDKSHIASATSGKTSVGWGPFSISASYSHSESHDKTKATFANGEISIPGMQIIAWVNEITPPCAPMAHAGAKLQSEPKAKPELITEA